MQVTFMYPSAPPSPASPRDALRAAGLRRTPARIAVLSHLEALDRPVSHAELAARPELAAHDQITLYRTLHALEEAGLVHRVTGLDGVRRYAAQPHGRPGCPGNHAHFLCTACGAMTCLLDQPMPRVEAPPGAEVQGRHFLATGRCAGCVAQGALAAAG